MKSPVQIPSIGFRRLLLALAMTSGCLAFATSLRGQDTITNVMSPVASFQYYDSPGTETNSQVISLGVAYQFYDSQTENGTNSIIISPVASLQYFDWPTPGSIPLLHTLLASYYYYGDTSPPTVTGIRLLSGNGLVFSGTSSSLSRPYFLLATTNLSVPCLETNGRLLLPTSLTRMDISRLQITSMPAAPLEVFSVSAH